MSTRYRWLIEHYASPTDEPLYLTQRGGNSSVVDHTRWTRKPFAAMQFGSKEDAQRYAKTFLIGPMRVAEHGFGEHSHD